MSMTQHFSGLTEGEQERFVILAEECAEVQQAICKALRHGLESNNNGKLPETNRQAIEREVGDLLHALERLIIAEDLNEVAIRQRAKSKPEHVKAYLHHQVER